MVALIRALLELVDPGGGLPARIDMPKLRAIRQTAQGASAARMRAVFALPPGAEPPALGPGSLARYHDYLRGRLVFPFVAAHFDERAGEPTDGAILAVRLADAHCCSMSGLECEVLTGLGEPVTVPLSEVRPDGSSPNRQLLDDYRHWLRREAQ